MQNKYISNRNKKYIRRQNICLRNLKQKNKNLKKLFLLFFCAFFCVFFFSYTTFQSNARQHPNELLFDLRAASTDPEFDLSFLPQEADSGEQVITGTVQPGETLGSILGAWLSAKDLHSLNKAVQSVYDAKKIRAGMEYKITLFNDIFVRFEYIASKSHYLEVDNEDGLFTATYSPFSYETTPMTIHGTIRTTLSEAIGPGNLSLAVRLANLFGWEIDFTRDLREGDSFSVYVEKHHQDGQLLGYGTILAAEFNVRGKRYDAYRFQNADGSYEYYNSKGKGLGQLFIKAPVVFTRITSGFSLSRYHPISKRYQPHYGVDYAAPTGTPIYALGAGTLTMVKYSHTAGKYISIDHGSGYETSYLHMSRFARGMRAGKKVSQGELIGYVGQTGYATGPHLCFRMKKDGKPVDPTRIDIPRSKELPKAQKEQFMTLVENIQPKLAPNYHYAQAEVLQKETKESIN